MDDQKARMLAGELYRADDSVLVAERHRCALQIERVEALEP